MPRPQHVLALRVASKRYSPAHLVRAIAATLLAGLDALQEAGLEYDDTARGVLAEQVRRAHLPDEQRTGEDLRALLGQRLLGLSELDPMQVVDLAVQHFCVSISLGAMRWDWGAELRLGRALSSLVDLWRSLGEPQDAARARVTHLFRAALRREDGGVGEYLRGIR